MAGAPPKSFSTPAEAKAAMVVMVDILSSNRAQLLTLLEGQDTQQKKIAAIMPEMQKLLAPEMTKLGFPPGPMGLMMGFAAFKKASTELEGCAVIQKGERVASAAAAAAAAAAVAAAAASGPDVWLRAGVLGIHGMCLLVAAVSSRALLPSLQPSCVPTRPLLPPALFFPQRSTCCRAR
jgi:hypothetical protein